MGSNKQYGVVTRPAAESARHEAGANSKLAEDCSEHAEASATSQHWLNTGYETTDAYVRPVMP